VPGICPQVQRGRRQPEQHRRADDLGRPAVRDGPLLHHRRPGQRGDAVDDAGAEFKNAYGVDIKTGPLAGVCARAVVVVDENDTVKYSELVSEIKQEPNYDAALAALK
jgi:hypothetical protein